MNQTQVFINGEGDAWLERNRRDLGQRDPVSEAIEALGIKPARVLEVGCSNGWRLKKLRDRYGCEVHGLDPSKVAVALAQVDTVHRGWADQLRFDAFPYDLLIYGFCLYVTEPEDWFEIVAQADAALENGGHVIIHDFAAEHPHARRYAHHEDVLSYHVDFRAFWLAHPWYSLKLGTLSPDGSELVSVLAKNTNAIEIEP